MKKLNFLLVFCLLGCLQTIGAETREVFPRGTWGDIDCKYEFDYLDRGIFDGCDISKAKFTFSGNGYFHSDISGGDDQPWDTWFGVGSDIIYPKDEEVSVSFLSAVAEVPAKAFAGWRVKKVEVSTELKKVGYRAFFNCSDLEEFTFYGNEIQEDAFKGCIGLNSFTIDPKHGNVDIGKQAFSWFGPKKFIIKSNDPDCVKLHAESFYEARHDITLCVPKAAIHLYVSHSTWKNWWRIESIEEGKTVAETYKLNFVTLDSNSVNRPNTFTIRVDEPIPDSEMPKVELLYDTINSDLFQYVSAITSSSPWIASSLSDTAKITVASGNYRSPNISVKASGTTTLTVRAFEGRMSNSLEFIVLPSRDAKLRSLYVGGATLTSAFNPDTLNYMAITPPGATSVIISAGSSSSRAAGVTGTGEKILIRGNDNTFQITVTAEDEVTTRTYTVKCIDSDPTLKSLSVKGLNISPEFRPNRYFYALETVPYTTDSLTVLAESNYPSSRLEGVDKRPLAVGDNTLNISVTAQDGTRLTYIINVRRLSGDANLKKIEISGATPVWTDIPSPFNPNITEYNIVVNSKVSTLSIDPVRSDTLAIVEGSGTIQIVPGLQTFKLKVVAEEKIYQKTYTINVKRLSDVATLKHIGSDLGALYPQLNSDTLEYTLGIPRTDAVTVTAEPTHPASIITGTGTKPVIDGDTTVFNIEVTPEDTTDENLKKIYTVKCISSDATLKTLTVRYSSRLLHTFDFLNFNKPLYVDNSVDYVIVDATVYEAVEVEGTGHYNLKEGDNLLDITVIAKNGARKFYQVKIVRAKNSDATLRSLSISPGILSPSFHPSGYDYSVILPNTTDSINISAETERSASTLSGTGTYPLNIGDNPVELKVTAADSTVLVYTVNARRISNDATLKYLTAGYGAAPHEFDVGKTNHTLDVANEIDSIILDFAPNYPAAELRAGDGYTKPGTSYPLAVDNNKFYIGILAEDRQTSSLYTVNVHRQGSQSRSSTSLREVSEQLTHVYVQSQALYVESPEAEQITVYSITGNLLYNFKKSAGKASFDIHHSPGSLLIVKGSSGWIKKVII